MKLLATADLHIGMKFGTYDEVKGELADARYDALARCIEISRDEECDLLIIAGDLFDRQNVSRADIGRTADILSGFEGAALLVLPGNHDFFTGVDGGPWETLSRRMESGSAPFELLSEGRVYSLGHYGLPVSIWPGPCTAKHSDSDAVSWIPGTDSKREDGEMVIGVAHGSLQGLSPDQDRKYYPMTTQQLKNTGADLWIVGHTHTPYPEGDSTAPWLFVPGTPEPDGFDCSHAGGAWVVDLTPDGVSAYCRRTTGTYRFLDVKRRIRHIDDIGQVTGPERGAGTLLRLTLEGALGRDEYEKIGGYLAGLKEELLYLRPVLRDLEEVVDTRVVEDEFTDGSFPSRLLKGFLEQGDVHAAQIAYQLLRGVAP